MRIITIGNRIDAESYVWAAQEAVLLKINPESVDWAISDIGQCT